MKNRFSIELVSDLDFEGLVVDISIENQVIARLNYDKGIDKIEMELIPLSTPFAFPLAEFFETLERVKTILFECSKDQSQG